MAEVTKGSGLCNLQKGAEFCCRLSKVGVNQLGSLCTKNILGQVSIETLDQHLFDTHLTLDQHLG